MTRIVFLDEHSLVLTDLSPLRALGDYTGYELTHRNEIVERCKNAQVIICNKTIISHETMKQLPDLKLIAIAATGMNNVDLEAAAEYGIEVRNVAGYSTHSVAEATLTGVLSLFKNTIYYDNYFKSGEYSKSDRIFNFGRPIRELRGSNWGIIGLGAIGREVARLASAFGCNVAYTSTSGVERQEAYERKNLDELLAWADVISIHAPLSDATRNLIGHEQFLKMKRNAVIVNVARGGIIDEVALAEAINNATIAGAVLDVFSHEPLRESPLYSLSDPLRLIASPHTAWASDVAQARLVECIAENIKSFIDKQ